MTDFMESEKLEISSMNDTEPKICNCQVLPSKVMIQVANMSKD